MGIANAALSRRHLLAGGMALGGAAMLPACKPVMSGLFTGADAHPGNYPTVRAVEFMGRYLDERTGGRLGIKMFAGGQLGRELAWIVERIVEARVLGLLDLFLELGEPARELPGGGPDPLGVFLRQAGFSHPADEAFDLSADGRQACRLCREPIDDRAQVVQEGVLGDEVRHGCLDARVGPHLEGLRL